MVKTYNFSQTFITALVEFKLTELCETEGMELLIAPTSLLACDDTNGFFNDFVVGSGARTWRNYFATSLLIRIPAYHTISGNLIKIYFMTRNKTVDDCIIVPSGHIIAVKDYGPVAINEAYCHYNADYGIDTSLYINTPTSETDPLLEDLTTRIAQRVFQVIKKYYK